MNKCQGFLFDRRKVKWKLSFKWIETLRQKLLNLRDVRFQGINVLLEICSLCGRNVNMDAFLHFFIILIIPGKINLKVVVSATLLLICFSSPKEHFKTRKNVFHSLQKLSLFSRKSNFRILDIQISWRHQMPKHKARNTFYWIAWEVNTVCEWNSVNLCHITNLGNETFKASFLY